MQWCILYWPLRSKPRTPSPLGCHALNITDHQKEKICCFIGKVLCCRSMPGGKKERSAYKLFFNIIVCCSTLLSLPCPKHRPAAAGLTLSLHFRPARVSPLPSSSIIVFSCPSIERTLTKPTYGYIFKPYFHLLSFLPLPFSIGTTPTRAPSRWFVSSLLC